MGRKYMYFNYLQSAFVYIQPTQSRHSFGICSAAKSAKVLTKPMFTKITDVSFRYPGPISPNEHQKRYHQWKEYSQ